MNIVLVFHRRKEGFFVAQTLGYFESSFSTWGFRECFLDGVVKNQNGSSIFEKVTCIEDVIPGEPVIINKRHGSRSVFFPTCKKTSATKVSSRYSKGDKAGWDHDAAMGFFRGDVA